MRCLFQCCSLAFTLRIKVADTGWSWDITTAHAFQNCCLHARDLRQKKACGPVNNQVPVQHQILPQQWQQQQTPAGPQQGMFQQSIPQQGVSMQGMLQQSIPQQGVSQQGMAQQSMPQQGVSVQGMPQQSIPQHGVSQQGMPQQSIPQQGVSQQGMPQQSIPQHGVSQQGMPQQSIPQQGVSQQGMPQQSIPQQGVSMQGMPQQGMPQQSLARRLPDSFATSLSNVRPGMSPQSQPTQPQWQQAQACNEWLPKPPARAQPQAPSCGSSGSQAESRAVPPKEANGQQGDLVMGWSGGANLLATCLGLVNLSPTMFRSVRIHVESPCAEVRTPWLTTMGALR